MGRLGEGCLNPLFSERVFAASRCSLMSSYWRPRSHGAGNHASDWPADCCFAYAQMTRSRTHISADEIWRTSGCAIRGPASVLVSLPLLHGWVMTGEKRYSHVPFLHVLDRTNKKHFFDAAVLQVRPAPHLESGRSIFTSWETLVCNRAGQRSIDAARRYVMTDEYLDLTLVQNREIVRAIWGATSSLGRLLICHGCDDVEAVIVGFLVDKQSEQAWPLCGSCVRNLPPRGALT
jgi:hypothetical protein